MSVFLTSKPYCLDAQYVFYFHKTSMWTDNVSQFLTILLAKYRFPSVIWSILTWCGRKIDQIIRLIIKTWIQFWIILWPMYRLAETRIIDYGFWFSAWGSDRILWSQIISWCIDEKFECILIKRIVNDKLVDSNWFFDVKKLNIKLCFF